MSRWVRWAAGGLALAGAAVIVLGVLRPTAEAAMPLPEQPFQVAGAAQLPAAGASGDQWGAADAGDPDHSSPANGTRLDGQDGHAAPLIVSPEPAAQVGQPSAGGDAAAGAPTVPVSGTRSADFPAANTLYIPALGVTAPLVPERAVDGALVIPDDPTQVGLYTGNPGVQAAAGTTVLAGHVNYRGMTGALFPLSRIRPNTLIVTTDDAGRAWAWRTVGLQVTAKSALPALPATGVRLLAIVTCGGPFDAATHSYQDNVIATAVPA